MVFIFSNLKSSKQVDNNDRRRVYITEEEKARVEELAGVAISEISSEEILSLKSIETFC